MAEAKVLIVGGGPVGLICALMLGRRGISVRIFETHAELQDDPRAATTHPATLDILAETGLVDGMARLGLVAPIFQFWDRPSGKLVAEFDHSLLSEDTRFPFVVQCEQFKTASLVAEMLKGLRSVEVLFGHQVVGVSQSEHEAAVTVRGPEGLSEHTGSYVVGADGGRSTVRKEADIDFEGFTWEERFLVLTTPFDFTAAKGYCPRSYFADPDQWCNCFKVAGDGPPGLWRTVFPTNPNQTDEEILNDNAVQTRLQKFFPSTELYEIVHRNLYVTHQRVAKTFRKGRVLLAGDAAHVNNPIGGMGLNGGIQDAANLADKLAKVLMDGQSDRLLDLYDLQRRTVTIEFVQQQSIENKKRLEAREPELRKQNLEQLQTIAGDPRLARDFLLRSSMIAMQRRSDSIAFP